MFKRRRKIGSLSMSGVRKRKRKKFIFFLSAMLFLIVVFVFLFAILLRVDNLKIKSVFVYGNSAIRQDEILKIVNDKLNSKYLKIFPRDNILLCPKSEIETQIYDAFKRVKNADIETDGLNSLILRIKEREPFALWCGAENSDEYQECYFMDNSGYIYSRAPNFSGNVFIKYYGTINAGKFIGSTFMDAEEFSKVSFLIKSLESINLTPIFFAVNKNGNYEIYLGKNSGGGGIYDGKIIFDKSNDIGQVFANLKSILENNIVGNDKDKNLRLDYIDLRFGKKIIYKFKE